MKIVTYNVNGLRQRVSQHGSLLKLLSSLDADIICFQETKLQRQDLSVDVTMAEGYEAFLSCTRTSSKGRLGYSGVATFCRVSSAFSTKDVALPLSVEEGFTGLLETSKREDNSARDFLIDKILDVEGLEDTTNEDLLKVDSEGRCIITDHGHFVLFNLYGPRADCDDKERTRFKFLFYKVLQRRWESLLSQGKRLVVVGDLNIAPTIIDRCDAEPEFEKNLFRTWLRSLLRECGGPFVDVFRSKHPGREGAYTCFSSRIGAEEFNYGSRIDHILIGGPCLHKSCGLDKHTLFDCHVIECDIMSQFIRGNFVSKPKWQGGRSIKLEGSDHVPVYAILDDIPDVLVHSTPPLAVRYVPEVRGWQQTIVPFLKKKRLSDTCEHPILSDNALGNGSDSAFTSLDNDKPLKCKKGLISTQLFLEPHQSSLQKLDHNSCNSICSEGNQPTSCLDMEKKNYFHGMDSSVKRIRRAVYSQRTLRSFFQKPVPKLDSAVEEKALKGSLDLCDYNKSRDDLPYGTELIDVPSFLPAKDHLCGVHVSDVRLRYVDQDDTFSCCSSKTENKNTALLEWKRIQQKMKLSIPFCKGHSEPCVARSVKKEGTNNGRRFYCCARAQGPAANPEANCGHFEWATKRAKHKN